MPWSCADRYFFRIPRKFVVSSRHESGMNPSWVSPRFVGRRTAVILTLRATRERRVTPAPVLELPALTSSDRGRIALLYQFVRLQLPTIRIPEPKFLAHLERSFRLFQA